MEMELREVQVLEMLMLHLMGDVDESSMKDEIETCKHFLMDSELDNGRRRVWNFAMETLYPKSLLEKLDVVFRNLEIEAKLNVTFAFCSRR